MLALYGHPFSSYTWKVQIALYANGTPFEARVLQADHPEHAAFVATAAPQGKFPVLVDGERTVIESSAIIEYLHRHHPGPAPLLPADPGAAIEVRMIDRVFDNSVMNLMQESVAEAIRTGTLSEATRADVAARLERSYRWIERWLGTYPCPGAISLIECAAAPSLFYADWVHRIPADCPRLIGWRTQLLAMPAVARCVDEARPWRHYFPLGAPDRD